MQIYPSLDSTPFAGAAFHFDVVEAMGPVAISAAIDDTQLGVDDCADPPCHRMSLFLPPDSAGKTLRIRAQSATGDVQELVLQILHPTGGSGRTGARPPLEGGVGKIVVEQ